MFGLKLLAYGALAGGLLTDSTMGRGEVEVFGEGMIYVVEDCVYRIESMHASQSG